MRSLTMDLSRRSSQLTNRFMSQTIPAVFAGGVFRPLEPVELAEGTRVVVQLESLEPFTTDDVDEETRRAWSYYLDRMECLPDHSPRDGLTNRDHDRIIYGG
jgi:predicted DNA-binding antitoxin AbrB/MazE fold protein